MKKLLLSLALIAVSFTSIAQVGVGATTPDPSAALDVESTTKGFLPPRMTQVQMNAIANPAAGLIVYCTDCTPSGLFVNNGATFLRICVSEDTPTVAEDEILSPTGKIWLDKNLGAASAATSSTDAASYGDLYQWGRTTDGHQIRTSTTVMGPVDAGTEGAKFILNDFTFPYDWLSAPDGFRWNAGNETEPVKGAHDPCPEGYRVPTRIEWQEEINSWEPKNIIGAFTALKLTLGGVRHPFDGGIQDATANGYYWTSTVFSNEAYVLKVSSGDAIMIDEARVLGASVRCVKD